MSPAGLQTGVLARVAALGCLWGTAFLFVHIALRDLSALQVSFGRLAGAGAILTIMVAATRSREARRLPSGHARLTVLGLAFTNGVVPYTSIAYAQTQVASSVAAIFNAATPLITLALAVIIRAEPPLSPRRVLGVAVGFCGVAWMFGFAVADGPIGARLALMVAATSYAISFIIAGRAQISGVDSGLVAARALSWGAVLIFPVVVAVDGLPAHPSYSALLALLGLAVLATALPYLIYLNLVRDAGPSAASLATYVVPVVGVLLGWAFLNESISGREILGASLVLIGVWLAQRRVIEQ